jgi:hypothetical protein
MMEHYEPIMSFGEDTAEIYDTEPDAGHRGETLATVSFLESLAGVVPYWNLRSAPVESRCPWPLGVFASTASTSQPQWSPSCAPSRVATRLR